MVVCVDHAVERIKASKLYHIYIYIYGHIPERVPHWMSIWKYCTVDAKYAKTSLYRTFTDYTLLETVLNRKPQTGDSNIACMTYKNFQKQSYSNMATPSLWTCAAQGQGRPSTPAAWPPTRTGCCCYVNELNLVFKNKEVSKSISKSKDRCLRHVRVQ